MSPSIIREICIVVFMTSRAPSNSDSLCFAHTRHNLSDGLDRSGLAQNHLAAKCVAFGGTFCFIIFFEGQLGLNS